MGKKWIIGGKDEPFFYNEKTRVLSNNQKVTIARLWINADDTLSILLGLDTNFIPKEGEVIPGLTDFHKPYTGTFTISKGGTLEYQKKQRFSSSEEGKISRYSIEVFEGEVLPKYVLSHNVTFSQKILRVIGRFFLRLSGEGNSINKAE